MTLLVGEAVYFLYVVFRGVVREFWLHPRFAASVWCLSCPDN